MRQTKLASQARRLQRRIYASLPLNIRLSHFFLRLAAMSDAEFGRLVFAYFILNEVPGMPEIRGEASPEDLAKLGDMTKIYRKLPRGYGASFGRLAKAVIQKKIKRFPIHDSQEVLEDAMGHALMKISMKPFGLKGSVPNLEAAQGYVITMMENFVLDQVRSRARRKEDQMPSDSEGHTIEFEDPDALFNALNSIPRSEALHMIRDLENVARTDNQRDILELKLKGYRDSEIAKKLGLSQAAIHKFFQGPQGEQMRRVIREYL